MPYVLLTKGRSTCAFLQDLESLETGAHALALPADSSLAVDHCKLEANSVLSGFGEFGNFLWPEASGIVTRASGGLSPKSSTSSRLSSVVVS